MGFAVHALYGGAAAMLIRRFGVPKAIAIPVVPALLLILGVSHIISAESKYGMTIFTVVYYLLYHRFGPMLVGTPNVLAVVVVVYFVPAVVCTWLAFWLYSRWARKRRMIESGLVPP